MASTIAHAQDTSATSALRYAGANRYARTIARKDPAAIATSARVCRVREGTSELVANLTVRATDREGVRFRGRMDQLAWRTAPRGRRVAHVHLRRPDDVDGLATL